MTTPPKRIAYAGAFVTLLLGSLTDAYALPSFARQTGLSCGTCHTVFPELTPFGRSFKLHGYTQTNTTSGQSSDLQEGQYPPLSVMIQASLTSIAARQPGTQNGNVQLPDQLSLFYAGRIADKLGGFIQVTYDGVADHFSMDNTDIRFADDASSGDRNLVYGITLNNNPTVQDLWNSTPAWGFPYAASSVAPTPAAATKLDGTLAQQVAGLGGYALWNQWLYGELSLYRSSQIGGNQPPNSSDRDIIDGSAPYWRLAVQHERGNHSFEAGAFGLIGRFFPGGGTPLSGPTDKFRDVALDAQYQYLTDVHIVTLHSAWIREKQGWDAGFPAGNTANATDTLRTLKTDFSYYYRRRYGGALGYFTTSGSHDAILYQPSPTDGSRSGTPDSAGWVIEASYLPWLNTKFTIQYTYYDIFNGSRSNYDGAGRDAADNNTLYLNAWLMF